MVFQRPLPRLLNYVCRHSTLSGNCSLWCFRDHSLVLWTMYVDIVHYRAMIDFGVSETTPALVNYVCRHSALSGNDRLWCFRDHSLVLWTMYVDIVHYRAMIDFGVSETTPALVNYVCRHSALSGNDRLWCFRDHSLVLWTMYVDIVQYRAMRGCGVSDTTPSSFKLCM